MSTHTQQDQQAATFPLHPFDALDQLVNTLPDTGEGGLWHTYSDEAYSIRYDSRAALAAGDRDEHGACVADALSTMRSMFKRGCVQ